MTRWPGPELGEPQDPAYLGPPQAAYPMAGAPGYPGAPTYPGYPGAPTYPGQPGYPAYPPAAYPPVAYPYGPYPPPGYPVPYPYGYPIAAPNPADVRPGTATAAAVLAFITAGLLAVAGMVLFFGGVFISDLEDAYGSGSHVGAELAIDGVIDLVAGGLLVGGGVQLIGRRRTGRTLLSVGGGIVAAAAFYWLFRFNSFRPGGDLYLDATLFLALAAVSVSLIWTTPVTRWLNRPVG